MPDSQLIQQYQNVFNGGLDTDTVVALLGKNKLRDAQNVRLVKPGDFLSLTNIVGTAKFGNLPGASSTTTIHGIYSNNYQIIGASSTYSNQPCLTIFGYDNNYFYIWCYNTTGNNISGSGPFYLLYKESLNINYLGGTATDKVLDAIAYGEYGYDDLYFTDNANEPRKLQCIIPYPYSAGFLKSTQLALPERKAIGNITTTVTSGGSLLTGTYQIAYQLLNPSINKYTRFSLLTNPIHVYTSDTVPKAGIGLPSTSKITVNINITSDEASNYTHFRLALLSNIYPEGTVTVNVPVTVLASMATYTVGTNQLGGYDIVSNSQINSVELTEIVTDLLQLDHAKTLAIKKNRLMLGNAVLKNLTYNNGTPTISGGTILQYSNANTAIKDTFTIANDSSTKKGHFRGEVYRYAISYFDKWGNFSSPLTLDMSSVQDNIINTAYSKDMKFPTRDYVGGGSRYYTVLNSNDQTVSLGLQLNNITNHPTWAVGFVILRAVRKKNIIFQSPFIPMANVFGPGALNDYPTIYVNSNGNLVTQTTATPMGPSTVLMPPNLSFGALTAIDTSGYGANVIQGDSHYSTWQGEPTHLKLQSFFSNALIYPSDSMYTKLSPFIPTGNEQIIEVDMAAVKAYYSTFSPTVIPGTSNALYYRGISSEDSSSLSYFTTSNTQMYHASGYTQPSALRSSPYLSMTGYKYFDNLSPGTSLNGKNILDSTQLTTPNVTIGYPSNNQRSGVVEVGYPGGIVGAAVLNSPITGMLTFPGLGTTTTTAPYIYAYEFSMVKLNFGALTSGFITSDPYGNDRTLTNAITIANVTNPQSDGRYGASTTQNEFILTGCQYNFSDTEIANYVSTGTSFTLYSPLQIWGGDCFVSYHTFKVSETNWSIMNHGKTDNITYSVPIADVIDGTQYAANASARYTNSYIIDGSNLTVLHIPFFFKNHAQYITLPLESTHLGSVRDIDTPDIVTTVNTIPIYGAVTENKCRAPMGYNYNINLSQENNQKIFIPIDPNIPVITNYRARVYYSDIKVYQSLINGFDTLRVDNYYDYEERYGGITKIALVGDDTYGIQEKAIFYIPLNTRVMETTNASFLAVRTTDFISEPLYMTLTKGCQNIQSIAIQGQYAMLVDNNNKQILRLQDRQIEVISNAGLISAMESHLSGQLTENTLSSLFDIVNNEYWIWNKAGDFCYIWNDNFKCWVSNYQFAYNSLLAGVQQNGVIWLAGNVLGDTSPSINNIYVGGTNNNLLGTQVTPQISFVINPNLEWAKTFDNMIINSTDRLASLNLSTDKEAALGNQTMTTVNLQNITTRGQEGGYMLKTLRDANNSRMRGLYANCTIIWPTSPTNPSIGITSVVTNARLSTKIF